jgi:hypothetical protein
MTGSYAEGMSGEPVKAGQDKPHEPSVREGRDPIYRSDYDDEDGPDALISDWASPEAVAVGFVAGQFLTAFVQALGKRAGDAAADLPRNWADLMLRRIRKQGQPDEFPIGPGDGSAATIVVTDDTPDEARLALLDLDVTGDDVRGKTLRWDNEAMTWRADDPEDKGFPVR